MKKLITLLLPFIMSGCCLSQIPTQYYFVNDSCEFFLPDYSQAVEVRDNCCVAGFTQDPPSGMMLAPGNEIIVTLTAMDCYGNSRSMTFDVVTVDTIPPTFHYDSTQFIPSGMYQNEMRTWKFYTVIDSMYIDENGNPDFDLYYRDMGWAALQETHNKQDSMAYPNFISETYYKRAIFFAESSYILHNVKLFMSSTGNPTGDIYVSLFELDQDDNPVSSAISFGTYPIRQLWTDQNLWHVITMQQCEIIQGRKYAINVSVTGVDNENYVTWVDDRSTTPNRYLRYTYDRGATWGRNLGMDYMFEIWGVPVQYANQ